MHFSLVFPVADRFTTSLLPISAQISPVIRCNKFIYIPFCCGIIPLSVRIYLKILPIPLAFLIILRMLKSDFA